MLEPLQAQKLSPLYQPQPYTELFIEFAQQNQRKYSF